MKYLLLSISVLTLLIACNLGDGDHTKYEIAADKEIGGKHMKAFKAGDRLELNEDYPLEDGKSPQRMLMDSPEERKNKKVEYVKNRKDGVVIPFPEEERRD